MLREIRRTLPTSVLFLEASKAALLARYSETRRPHPLGREERVTQALQEERRLLEPIRNVADVVIDTTKFNVHELRSYIQNKFILENDGKNLLISSTSFGYKKGVPLDADLVFDVRFLPNPHFIPEFRNLPATSLHQRGEELSHAGVWLHRRPTPVRHDCRGGCPPPGAARLYRQDRTSRHTALAHFVPAFPHQCAAFLRTWVSSDDLK